MTSYSRAGVQSDSHKNVILTTILAGSVLGGGLPATGDISQFSNGMTGPLVINSTGVLSEATRSFSFRYTQPDPETIDDIMGRVLLSLQASEDSLTPDMECLLFKNRMALYEA